MNRTLFTSKLADRMSTTRTHIPSKVCGILMFVFCWLNEGCVSGGISPQQVRSVIEQESIFAGHQDFQLEDVTVNSVDTEGKMARARVTIRFNSRRGGTWGNEGARDPIPTYYNITEGSNTLDVTANLSRYDDGAWHLDQFVM